MAWLIGRYLAFTFHTTRWTLEGEATLAHHVSGHPAIFAFWHEHLPLLPALVMTARRMPGFCVPSVHTLVSHHRDGRLIGNIVRRFDIELVLGSSSRGGADSLRRLKQLVDGGSVIGITPDGPRGPRRQAAPGIAQLAALTGVPVVPCAVITARHVRLGTWDRMVLPLPFGRGVLVCGPAIRVERGAWREALPRISAAIDQAADRAGQSCAV
ncbi:MAG: lysophospholipid acyltransferase family protein [Gammaproteobacteria bacterium]